MTGYNRMNQRNAIRKDARPLKEQAQDYFPCPKCGEKMKSERRAAAHCKDLK